MQITISEENKIIWEEIKTELNQIKQEAKELSISILIQLKTLLFQFILSYKEYSLTNIRAYGLTEILLSRANRFFRLENDTKKQKKTQPKKKSKIRFKFKASKVEVNVRSKNLIQEKISLGIKSKNKSKKIGIKYILKKILKLILFPFYLLILIIGTLLEPNDSEKKKKNVKNEYKPY